MPRRIFVESVKKALRRQAQITALQEEMNTHKQSNNIKGNCDNNNLHINNIQCENTIDALSSKKHVMNKKKTLQQLHYSQLPENQHNSENKLNSSNNNKNNNYKLITPHSGSSEQTLSFTNSDNTSPRSLSHYKVGSTIAKAYLSPKLLLLSEESLESLSRSMELLPEWKGVHDALTSSSSKAEVMTVFTELTATEHTTLNPYQLQIITVSMLKNHVALMVGGHAECKRLLEQNGLNNSTPERWRGLSLEEERVFLHSCCHKYNRYLERSYQYSVARKANIEGTDNDYVTAMEFYMRKRQHELLSYGVVPVIDVVLDLMQLNIGWRTAMRLYEYSRELTTLPPPTAMMDRLLCLMTCYRSNGLGHRPWELALSIYKETISKAPCTPTLRTFTAALNALWRRADSFHKLHNSNPITHEEQDAIWYEIVSLQRTVQALSNRQSYSSNSSSSEDNNSSNNNVSLIITGEDGCAYMESLIKALCACGRHARAIELLQQMDLTENDTSFRLLVPTPETFLFIIAALYTSGELAHANAIRELFDELHYTLRSVHSECLLIYLQSLRHITERVMFIGNEVASLVNDGNGLDRPCAVACLQLLAHPSVVITATATATTTTISGNNINNSFSRSSTSSSSSYSSSSTTTSSSREWWKEKTLQPSENSLSGKMLRSSMNENNKSENNFSSKSISHNNHLDSELEETSNSMTCKTAIARKLLHYYINENVWIQHAEPRKVELNNIFRCCHVIDSIEKERGNATLVSLEKELQEFIHGTFGEESSEAVWLRNTEIYSLRTTSDWEYAMELYNRVTRQTSLTERAELPLPIRQIREMVLMVLLRSCRFLREYYNESTEGTVPWALLDDEAQDAKQVHSLEQTSKCVKFVQQMYQDEYSDETPSHALIAELFLLHALQVKMHNDEGSSKQQHQEQVEFTARAIRELSYGGASEITHSVMELASQLLNTSTLHTETALIVNHARLRYQS